jgi:DNA ligase-1
MGSPAKRRKLNDSSKSSPAPSRNLDFFFGKQKQNPPSRASNHGERDIESPNEGPNLTDEELARKLQAEWDQEEASENAARQNYASKEADGILGSSGPPDSSIGLQPTDDTYPDGKRENKDESGRLDSKPEKPQQEPKGNNTLSLQSTGSAEDAITSNIPFDESSLTFEPSKYVEDLQSHWAAEGGNASYALLTRCFVLINSTQSRIKIVDTLVNALRVIIEGDPSSLLPTVRTIYCFCYIS